MNKFILVLAALQLFYYEYAADVSPPQMKEENGTLFKEESTKVEDYLEKLSWSYGNDETNWPGPYCKYGARQSPIDIKSNTAVRDVEEVFIKHGPLKFRNYREPTLVTAFNNGHTLQMISSTGNGSEPMVSGGPLREWYRFEQLHYHWPSEHSINGHKFAMESHFVHVRADLRSHEALSVYNGLAILVVFWNIVLGVDKTVKMPEHVPYLMDLMVPGAQVEDVEVILWEHLDISHKSYFTYAGSLSTPPCDEAVIWIIFAEPLLVSETLYRAFGFIRVQPDNYRSQQAIQEHRVYRTLNRPFLVPLVMETLQSFKKSLAQTVRETASRLMDFFASLGKKV